MPLDHEERDERPEPDDVEAALDSLAAAMITPSALPDEVAAAVVGYILSQAAPGKSTGSPQTLCESDRPLRVAVSLLLGHVKVRPQAFLTVVYLVP